MSKDNSGKKEDTIPLKEIKSASALDNLKLAQFLDDQQLFVIADEFDKII